MNIMNASAAVGLGIFTVLVAGCAGEAVEEEGSSEGAITSAPKKETTPTKTFSCSDITTARKCSMNRTCVWMERPQQGDDVGGVCLEVACEDFGTQDACDGHPACEWLTRPDQGDGVGSVCLAK